MNAALSSSSTATMWIVSSLIVLVSLFLGYPQPDLRLEQDILPLARTYAKSADASSATPLTGVRVVISGATSGIGLGLVQQFATMGATVIALGRSPQKLQALQESLPGKDIVPILVQLTDLASVQKAADDIASKFDRIDILVNNAGIHYIAAAKGNDSDAPTTPQGLDMSWGVNYMSHFLLTEKLLAPLKQSPFQPTVIQISSSYHWAVDGSELAIDTASNQKHPLVAVPGAFTGGVFGPQRAYANSKFAQILHARSLQRRHPELAVRSICPCWVGTGIAGDFFGFFLNRMAFPNDGFGIKSALIAALDTARSKSADYYTNSQSTLWMERLPSMFHAPWFYQYRLRDAIGMSFGGVLLTFQRFLPTVDARRSSPETYDEGLQESLYEWSYETVKPFL